MASAVANVEPGCEYACGAEDRRVKIATAVSKIVLKVRTSSQSRFLFINECFSEHS